VLGLDQGSQTLGPRATFGPRGHFVRTAMHFRNFQILTCLVYSLAFKSAGPESQQVPL